MKRSKIVVGLSAMLLAAGIGCTGYGVCSLVTQANRQIDVSEFLSYDAEHPIVVTNETEEAKTDTKEDESTSVPETEKQTDEQSEKTAQGDEKNE